MAPIAPDSPRYRVVGRVINDLNGRPIPGAVVRLVSLCGMSGTTGRNEKDYFQLQTVTNRKGKFAFEKIPAMVVRLSPSRDKYIGLWFKRTADALGNYVVGSKTGSITLRLAPAASIFGIARDQRGVPMPETSVTLRCLRNWDGWPQREYYNTTKTDDHGSYRLGPLPPGRYYLVAWLYPVKPPLRNANGKVVGYLPVRVPALLKGGKDTFLELKEGEQARVDFHFRRELLHHVTGNISGASAPIIAVIDRSGSRSYFVKSSLTDNQRTCCEFEGWLPSGSFQLISKYGADGNFVGSMPLHVTEGDISGIVLPVFREEPVRIPIEISSPAETAGGHPCAGVKVGCGFWYLQIIELLPNGYVKPGPQSTMFGGTQAGRGAFRTEDVTVAPGTYAVAVMTSGNVYARSILSGPANLILGPFVVVPSRAPDPIRIVLAKGATVKGITRRDGKPVRAWVYAIPEQPDARLFQPVRSETDGSFYLQGLAPVPYLFFATDVELNLDIHDPKILDYWRHRAQERTLRVGSTTSLKLQVSTAGD